MQIKKQPNSRLDAKTQILARQETPFRPGLFHLPGRHSAVAMWKVRAPPGAASPSAQTSEINSDAGYFTSGCLLFQHDIVAIRSGQIVNPVDFGFLAAGIHFGY
jgi:hypothetical protein